MKSERQLRRDRLVVLRQMVDGEKQLERLMEIADWLERKARTAGEIGPDGEPVEPMARPDQVALAKQEVELRLKLLDKCLPSLKAVEHSGGIETRDVRTMSSTELEHRLSLILGEQPRIPFLE